MFQTEASLAMLYFSCFMIAMIGTMAMIPPLIRFAPRLNFVDLPNDRKVHAAAIPRIGGVAMVLGSVVPLLLFLPMEKQAASIIGGMIIILIFGAWDDRKDLNYKIKFLGQLLAALVVVCEGGVIIRNLPFLDSTLPTALSWVLTIFVILAITNAMNLVDGLDGLAGGTTLLSLGAIAILAWHVDQQLIMLLALSIIGSILGFLRFNTHPARIFMGDSGSQFLGFTLAITLIILTQRSDVSLSLTLPFLLAGLPIIDTLTVMSRRLKEGRSPFSPDKGHLHHRLMGIGLNHYEVVIAIYIAQAVFVMAAYVMRFYSDVYILVFYLGYSAALLLMLSLAERKPGGVKMLTFKFRVETADSLFRAKRLLFLLGGGCFVLYLTTSIALPKTISIDFLLIAGLSAIASLIFLLLNGRSALLSVEKLMLYVLISVGVFFSVDIKLTMPSYKYVEWAIVAYLAFLVLVGFIFRYSKAFQITPLDVLLLIVVVGLANFSEVGLSGQNVGYFALKLAIMFYAAEMFMVKYAQLAILYRVIMLINFTLLTFHF